MPRKAVKEMSEEEMELGRLLGTVSSQKSSIVEEFKSVAREKRMKISRALEEAISLWIDFQELKNVDPASLLMAMKLYERMMLTSTKLLVEISKIFSGGLVQSQLQTIQQLLFQYTAQEQAQEQPSEQPQKQLPPELASAKAKLYGMMVNMLVNMLSTMMASMMKSFTGTSTPQKARKIAKKIEKIDKEEIRSIVLDELKKENPVWHERWIAYDK